VVGLGHHRAQFAVCMRRQSAFDVVADEIGAASMLYTNVLLSTLWRCSGRVAELHMGSNAALDRQHVRSVQGRCEALVASDDHCEQRTSVERASR
jgi:hypothetical protein